MRTILSIIAAISLCLAPLAGAQTMKCAPESKQEKKHTMTVNVTGIDNTNSSGVTRIAFDLVSMPHTSSRIDSVTAVINGKTLTATDIDGVDFERYFQWEDDGIVKIEVDFPLCKKFTAADKVTFHTVHGDYSTQLKSK